MKKKIFSVVAVFALCCSTVAFAASDVTGQYADGAQASGVVKTDATQTPGMLSVKAGDTIVINVSDAKSDYVTMISRKINTEYTDATVQYVDQVQTSADGTASFTYQVRDLGDSNNQAEVAAVSEEAAAETAGSGEAQTEAVYELLINDGNSNLTAVYYKIGDTVVTSATSERVELTDNFRDYNQTYYAAFIVTFSAEYGALEVEQIQFQVTEPDKETYTTPEIPLGTEVTGGATIRYGVIVYNIPKEEQLPNIDVQGQIVSVPAEETPGEETPNSESTTTGQNDNLQDAGSVQES